MVLATWQLLTVQLWPRGADETNHVIKNLKIFLNSENSFLKLKKIEKKNNS